jgi:transcriptional regulator with XRE-family HTH domain
MQNSSAVAARLNEIQERTGVSAREIAQMLDKSPGTVSGWRTGKAQPQPDSRDRLLQLVWLAGELAELYPPDEAKFWLFSPHKQLAGVSPAEKIQQGGIKEVLAIIAQIKDGAYV